MRMLCYKCGYPWNYKGKNTDGKGHITCPGCLYKIRVDKALMGELSEQKLLTNLPNKKLLPNKLPNEIPEIPNKIPTTNLKIKGEIPEITYNQKQELKKQSQIKIPKIKILSHPLPPHILKAFFEKEQDNLCLNLPKEKPNFTIRKIPLDPFENLKNCGGFI